ncbi:MAG: nucleotidyltransferase domain-containing protein [Bryobacteraceae bacterium]|jgi:predicted nucleotidyltransferase
MRTASESVPAPGVEGALRGYCEAVRPRGVVSAYLFGSLANGTAHGDSDVDVAVLLDVGAVPGRTERARAAMALNSALIAALHRNAVDVVVLNDAPPELATAAVTLGVRVYCADADADHAFARTVQLRLADIRPFLARTRRLKLEALAR